MLRMTWKWALPALVAGGLAAAVPAADIRFIVFSSSMGAGDVAMRNLMQSYGHTVTVKSAHSSSAADTTGQDLVVISSSVGLGEVNTKFRDVAKPVLIMKYGLFDEMGMVSAASGQAGGFAGYQTTILAPSHPLAAGLSGTLTVFSPADNLNWGMPSASALRIAALQGNHDRVTIFAYEAGAPMVGMDAPDRRLAFFYRDNGAARSTAQGEALFRAAIDWCLGADGPPQSAPVITSQPAPATVTAGQSASFDVAASGSPDPAFQWYRNGTPIAGATGATYTTLATDPADDAAVFTVTATNPLGATMSAGAVLTVQYAPSFLQPDYPAVQGPPGQPATIEALAEGNPAPVYSWTSTDPAFAGPDATGRIIHVAVPEGPAGASHSYTVTAANLVGTVSRTVTVTSTGFIAPVITNHPDSAYSYSGEPAAFMVMATGTPAPVFQWRRNGVDIPGATSSTYTLDSPTYLDDGAGFSVVVSNSGGSITSETGWLQVRAAPVILAQPASATVPAGQPHTFEVTAWGVPYANHQWRRNGVNIAGATSATYTLPVVAEEDHGVSFSVVVYNVHGADTSDAAALSVLYAPVIVSGPASAGVLAGQSHTFAVEVRANPAASFQWRKNGVDIPGATGTAWTTPPAELSDDGAFYTVAVSNSQGSVTSPQAVLHVEPIQDPPVIVSQPQDLFLYPGDNAVFRIGVSGEPHPVVSWTISGGTFEPGPHQGDSLWLGPVEAADHGLRVMATVQNPAGTVMSREAVLWVNQRPTRHLVSLTGELFDGSNLSPMGYDHRAGADVIVSLYTQAEGGTAVYTEEFLRAEGRGVVVDRGLFTVRLGQGRTGQNLSEAVARHDNLYAELTVQVEDLMRETLLPRTPITSPLVAGTPRILQGATDPVATEPVGTYYENTAAGTTWLRMPASWIRIAP